MIYEWTIEEWKQKPGLFSASSIRMVSPGEYRRSDKPGKIVEVVKEAFQATKATEILPSGKARNLLLDLDLDLA